MARARAAHDRRRNVVRLTAEGERVLRDTVEAAARVDGRLTAPLTPAERAELQRLLTRVLEAASRD